MRLQPIHWFLLFALILALCIALCRNSFASDGPRTVGVVEGDAVPFTGVLVDSGTFAGMMHDRLDLDAERVRAQQCLRYVDDINATLEDVAKKRPWYDAPLFRSIAGFVFGASVVMIAYEGARRNCCPHE
jgi:hypothetical protein